MIQVDPPVTYRHWSGKMRRSVNQECPWPTVRLIEVDGSWFEERVADEFWVQLGYAPAGSTGLAAVLATLASWPADAIPASIGTRICHHGSSEVVVNA